VPQAEFEPSTNSLELCIQLHHTETIFSDYEVLDWRMLW